MPRPVNTNRAASSVPEVDNHDGDPSAHPIEFAADRARLTALEAADTVVTANRQTDSYTLVLGDAGKCVEMNKASGNNLTVPANASVAFPVGTCVEIFQYGAGQTTVVADTDVTIRSSGDKLKITGQYSGASLRKIATNEWVLVGDIAS